MTLETESVIGGERLLETKVVKGVRCYWEKNGKCRIAPPLERESARVSAVGEVGMGVKCGE